MTRLKSMITQLSVLVLLMTLVVPQTIAHTYVVPPVRWEKLGMRKVAYRVDRDEIPVTIREGTFTALRLTVVNAPIDLSRVVVHYRNGDPQVLNVRTRIRAGGTTRVLDLPGSRRIITKVVLIYDTKNRARRRATVTLWGRR